MRTLLVLLGLGLAAAGGAQARERLPLWQVKTPTNSVYLLGSIHVLRPSDYPLAAAIDRAYADADVLIMELDLDDLDPREFQSMLTAKSELPAGQTLRDLLGEADYAKAEKMAAAIDMHLDLVGGVEPWYAALLLTNLQVAKLGYIAEYGIEVHFMQRAVRDGKEILGLETAASQLEIFDSLPLRVQRAMLLKTLEDLADADAGMETLLAAWRTGDTATLEDELLAGFAALPALREALLARRNRAWVKQLDEYIGAQDDYLVIVGALHLVGEDGVVEMLRRRGRTILRP